MSDCGKNVIYVARYHSNILCYGNLLNQVIVAEASYLIEQSPDASKGSDVRELEGEPGTIYATVTC
jgi:hypothetical protein